MSWCGRRGNRLLLAPAPPPSGENIGPTPAAAKPLHSEGDRTWRQGGGSRRAGSQLVFLDREYLAGFQLEIAHEANAPADVGELGVVAAGRCLGDPQPLVGIHRAILVVLALIGP